ncbi:MAG: transporter substrate-binding domain-containing protein [Synergistaceae bacterium]|nr:transporter substrate-binding domain-containing protein [Synergistaceae bacterium]
MKKLACAVAAVMIMCGACYGANAVHSGALTWLGTTESEFQEGLDDLRKALTPLISENSDWMEEDGLSAFLVELVKTRRVIHFYDSLLSMQMALRSKKLDEIVLPQAVGMYLLANNSNYDIEFSLNMMPSTIAFGFKRGNVSLQKEFNEAIAAMKKDGTLKRLEKDYITDLGAEEPERVEFTGFKGAKSIRAAVTGDLPPIDFIGADGRPAGYNTAILAEIGRRLKKNIRLISVDAGGRSAALASERADVVFWYRNTEGMKTPKKAKGKKFMKDSVDGVILSEPYYEWDVDLVIGRAE